jgi:DNA helicase II / ATP-dependent DNA helicase PcrA
MTAWKNFPAKLVDPEIHTPPRPRFSLTSDILSFRKCKRQYGYFGNDGFVPAQAVQIFFGQIIHQVLDRCHRHYSGLFGHPKGSMPTDAEIDQYFDEVEQALRAHGIRPTSPREAAQAKQILKTFNRIEGPVLYPRVIDTEYRLESERQNFVLRGVVDVLAADDTGAPEIWDYKGTDMPSLSSRDLRDYEWQMSVYAELYKVKTKQYPERAVLYFLNELKTKPGDPIITKRPVRARYVVDFMRDGIEPDGTPTLVKQGLEGFDLTAADIIACKQAHRWDAPSGGDVPDEKTCDICDIRWNCTAHPVGKYSVRMPI